MSDGDPATDPTFNRYAVGASSLGVVILNPPVKHMTRDGAIQLAAWLLVMADGGTHDDPSAVDAAAELVRRIREGGS